MTADAIQAESYVCGSIVIDANCLPEVMEHLTSDDFILEQNRAIFLAAVELDRAGEPIDPVTILKKSGEAASRDYLFDLMQATPTAANVGLYAEEVRKQSMRRSLRALSDTIAERTGISDDPRELIGDAKEELDRIEEQDTRKELSTSSDVMASFYKHREKVDAGVGGYVPTKFKGLDRILGGGFLNTGFYILAARPGMGKTTFAIGLAESIAEEVGPVLFVSLEMDEEQIAAKRIARCSGVSYDSLMMGQLSDAEYDKIANVSVKLSKAPFVVNKKSTATVDDIANMARKVKGLSIVVIDYFGLIKSNGKFRNKYESATETSGQLKALARKLGKPILCLAQINRENTQRQDKKPQLSDLRDTGALEQDADGVIFLHCPAYYTTERPEPWEPDQMEIIVAKNRHADTGVCDAAFYRAMGKIVPAK